MSGVTDEEQNGNPTKDRSGDVVALLRRTLVRIHTVENRLAALEERQHDLDDMAEQIRGMQSLIKRQRKVDKQVEDAVRAVMKTELDEKIVGRINSAMAKYEARQSSK